MEGPGGAGAVRVTVIRAGVQLDLAAEVEQVPGDGPVLVGSVR